MFDFDYIIPVCRFNNNSFEYRKKNLEFIIKQLKKQKNVKINIIIVEQILSEENKESFLNFDKDINYYKVFHKVFNKSWLYNIGAKKSKTDKLFFGEGDCCFFDKHYFEKILSLLKEDIKWCFCWNKIKYFDKISSEKILSEDNNFVETEYDYKREFTPHKGSAEGGIVFYRKKFFLEDLHGYSEFFENLGGEDNEVVFRSSKLTNSYIKLPFTIYHLFHPRFENISEEHKKNIKFLKITYEDYLKVNNFYKKLDIGCENPNNVNKEFLED